MIWLCPLIIVSSSYFCFPFTLLVEMLSSYLTVPRNSPVEISVLWSSLLLKHTQPHCGLVAVNCDPTPPTIQLETGGYQFQLLRVFKPLWSDYIIILGDSKLQRLIERRNYSRLNYTLQFPNSSSITFLNMGANLANNYFKCNYSQAHGIGNNYERYNCTDGFRLIYKPHFPDNPKCVADNCTLHPTPIIVQQINAPLSARFGLELQVSKACYDCYKVGGHCTSDSNNEFLCNKGNTTIGNTPTRNKSKLKPLLIAVLGGAALLTFMFNLLFYIYTKTLPFSSCMDMTTEIKNYQDVEDFLTSHGSLAPKRFTYSQVKNITDSFKNELGQGGFGSVYKISIGIARGLEYLHRGCNTGILHLDIKPHNILLDEDFAPKISDFGLAKLCTQQESIVSLLGARGTIGYIAPEVVCKNIGGVSSKSDVYSYGMMVLEMVGGRKNVDIGVSCDTKIYFPHWIYTRLVLDDELGLIGVMNEEDNECARRMLIVSLWCIQTDPSIRPSISRVVEMLEGKLEYLQIPPKPYLYSPTRVEEQHSQ